MNLGICTPETCIAAELIFPFLLCHKMCYDYLLLDNWKIIMRPSTVLVHGENW